MKLFTFALTSLVLVSTNAFADAVKLRERTCSRTIETRQLIEGGVSAVCLLDLVDPSTGQVTSRGVSVKNSAGQAIYALVQGKGEAFNGGGMVTIKYKVKYLGSADRAGNLRHVATGNNMLSDATLQFERHAYPGDHNLGQLEMDSVRATNFDSRTIALNIK